MRIVYIIPEDISKHVGLHYKISDQIRHWIQAGHEVFMMTLEDEIVMNSDGVVLYENNALIRQSKGKIGIFNSLRLKYRFICEALERIKPDLTYSRYLFPAINVNKIHKYAGKLVYEINSDDCAEYNQKNKLTGTYNSLFRHLSLKSVDAFVFVTKELSCADSFDSYSLCRLVVANGIEVTDCEFLRETKNTNPQLVFIGSPDQAWHGVDKLLPLTKMLNDCTFHIVGPSEQSCREMWGCIPTNVICHGYLSANNAIDVVKRMDVAIGTLALHRKKMSEACPLKVRQYLAHGLPVISGNKDTDITGEEEFYLNLPNVEGNISNNLDVIRLFINKVYQNQSVRKQARCFAFKFLSNKKKELARVRFFNEVIGQ